MEKLIINLKEQLAAKDDFIEEKIQTRLKESEDKFNAKTDEQKMMIDFYKNSCDQLAVEKKQMAKIFAENFSIEKNRL